MCISIVRNKRDQRTGRTRKIGAGKTENQKTHSGGACGEEQKAIVIPGAETKTAGQRQAKLKPGSQSTDEAKRIWQ